MNKLLHLVFNSVNSHNARQFVEGIHNVLPASVINKIAKDCGLVLRQRKFSPSAFAYAMVLFCSRGKVNSGQYTIANFLENYYNELLENDPDQMMEQRSFHGQLSKPAVVDFVTALIEHLQIYLKGKNPYEAHANLVKSYTESLGITDIVTVDGCELFARPSCADNFNCKTSGKKRTQRGVQKENTGIKIHGAFSNATGTFSHIDITEGVGSERGCINASDYPRGTLFIMDRGYIDYAEEEGYTNRGQYFLVKYRTNCKGEIIIATNENGAELTYLKGESPSCELPDSCKDNYIDMVVRHEKENTCVRLIRVRNIGKDANQESNEWSYYATNLPITHVPAFAVYLTYRCRWVGSEHSFKCLQTGNGMRTINSSNKVINITFILGNILSFLLKTVIVNLVKRIYKYEFKGQLSLLRVHLKLILSIQLLRAFCNGSRSTIYYQLKKLKSKILRSCIRKTASKRDIESFKDFPTVSRTIDNLLVA